MRREGEVGGRERRERRERREGEEGVKEERGEESEREGKEGGGRESFKVAVFIMNYGASLRPPQPHHCSLVTVLHGCKLKCL